MTDAKLLNPNSCLLEDVASTLKPARKTEPVWAKKLETTQQVTTLEGVVNAESGDYLCRGVRKDYWAQKAEKLHEKYISSGVLDAEGFQRFDPNPQSAPVHAVQIREAFCVKTQRGELYGKPLDYLVRSTTDPADVWIVAKAIFEASYEFI